MDVNVLATRCTRVHVGVRFKLIMMERIYNLCYRLSPLELLIPLMLGHEIGLIVTRGQPID